MKRTLIHELSGALTQPQQVKLFDTELQGEVTGIVQGFERLLTGPQLEQWMVRMPDRDSHYVDVTVRIRLPDATRLLARLSGLMKK